MDKLIDSITDRMKLLELRREDDLKNGLIQNMDYYRGALNELFILRMKLQKNEIR